MSEPGLLALVADDPLAPKVLAWWKSTKSQVADRDGEDLLDALTRDLGIESIAQARGTVRRCYLAGLLVDGDISELGVNWLNAWVAREMGIKRSRTTRKVSK